MKTQEYSLPFYEQVLEFLASGPSSQEITAYRPPQAAQARFSRLLEANRERHLSARRRSSTTTLTWIACSPFSKLRPTVAWSSDRHHGPCPGSPPFFRCNSLLGELRILLG